MSLLDSLNPSDGARSKRRPHVDLQDVGADESPEFEDPGTTQRTSARTVHYRRWLIVSILLGSAFWVVVNQFGGPLHQGAEHAVKSPAQSSPPSRTPSCTSSDLTAVVDRRTETPTYTSVVVQVRNISRQACRIAGYPYFNVRTPELTFREVGLGYRASAGVKGSQTQAAARSYCAIVNPRRSV